MTDENIPFDSTASQDGNQWNPNSAADPGRDLFDKNLPQCRADDIQHAGGGSFRKSHRRDLSR